MRHQLLASAAFLALFAAPVWAKDRPVTDDEKVKLVAAVAGQGCSGDNSGVLVALGPKTASPSRACGIQSPQLTHIRFRPHSVDVGNVQPDPSGNRAGKRVAVSG